VRAARLVRAGGLGKRPGGNADSAPQADPTERGETPMGSNMRDGVRAKTVLTEASGHVEIEVPRDRAGTFEPQIVKKRQRRLNGVDEIVLSLYAKGLTTGEISAHFAEIYGASVSKETISRITDKVIEEMNDWSVRPLDGRQFPVIVANPDGRIRHAALGVEQGTGRI
jgi:transposase-like protein